MALNPKQSAKFVVAHAKYIEVKELGIKNLANQIVKAINSGELNIKNFSQIEFHPNSSEDYALNWIFLVDTLNFCFWTPEKNTDKWVVDKQTGYFGLCAAVNRALKNGIDVTDPSYYSKITLEELDKIFISDDSCTKVPLLEERVKCLHEVGAVLIKKFDGKFENVVKEAGNSAEKLLSLVVENFPCFRDEANYNGKRVSLYKRAQILVGDVYACFRGEGLGRFDDINDTITMFADYRVPQVLVHFGSLVYSDDLMKELKEDKILINGEPKEVEIRAASIEIVEKV